MAAITALKLQKALSVVEAVLEANIQASADRATGYRNLLLELKRVDLPPRPLTPAAPAAPPKPSGKRPQAGTLPARILDIVGEAEDDSVSFREIMAANPGAPTKTCRKAVWALVRDGHLVGVGQTIKRRYRLPAKKGGR